MVQLLCWMNSPAHFGAARCATCQNSCLTSFLTFGLQICALCWHVERLLPCKLLSYNVEFYVNFKSASCFISPYFTWKIPRVMLNGRMCKVSVFHDMCMLSWWVEHCVVIAEHCAALHSTRVFMLYLQLNCFRNSSVESATMQRWTCNNNVQLCAQTANIYFSSLTNSKATF